MTTQNGETTPDGIGGGAAVRGKCTTGVDVYMVTELLDLGEMRLRGVLFFSFLVLEREQSQSSLGVKRAEPHFERINLILI